VAAPLSGTGSASPRPDRNSWLRDPFLVESDLAGNSLFERENAKIAPGLEQLYAGTKSATMRRYGETDDKTKEVIGE